MRLINGMMVALAGLAVAADATWPARAQTPVPPTQSGLSAFTSDRALEGFLRRAAKESAGESFGGGAGDEIIVTGSAPSPPPATPSPVLDAAAPAQKPGITNTQVAGVDEGGIVKLRGDTLVILRRGRLFTVSIAGGGMRAIDSINAFPDGLNGDSAWYDEMLVAGDRVIVVGFRYGARGGTEINRFRLDPAGRLRFEDSYQLRSNDYYSSRNYASRQIGNRLIFYTPLDIGRRGDPLDSMPGLRRYRSGVEPEKNPFRRIASAREIYLPQVLRDPRAARIDTLHSVTSCDMTATVLDCRATGVLGASSRTFYVSGEAVYLWISDGWRADRRRRPSAFLYRLPLDGGRPSALQARGSPVDQFSFHADTARRLLHVVLRASDDNGDAMWSPEVSEGAVALLSVPLSAFGTGAREAPLDRYQHLPQAVADSWRFRNRFVGDHLLYGSTAERLDDGRPGGGVVISVALADRRVTHLPLPHGVDRIEALGRDGLVVGESARGLGFSAIDLRTGPARIADRFTLPDAGEGEQRSHAFFFRPDPATPDGATGLLGLPVERELSEGGRFLGRSAAMLFLSRFQGRLAAAGELAARVLPEEPRDKDDDCVASCVDWYGNARPIFIRGRVFALMGYELVEGIERDRRVRERARIDFAPRRR